MLHHIWQRRDNHFSGSNHSWNLTFLQAQRTAWNRWGFPSIPVLPAALNSCYLAVVMFSSPLEHFPIPTCLFVPGPLCHMLSFLFSDRMSIGPDHRQIPPDSSWESGLGVGMKLTTKKLVWSQLGFVTVVPLLQRKRKR